MTFSVFTNVMSLLLLQVMQTAAYVIVPLNHFVSVSGSLQCQKCPLCIQSLFILCEGMCMTISKSVTI